MKMRRIVIALVLALALVGIITVPAFAATTQDVTVTVRPVYIAISNAGGDWTLNGITGDSYASTATTYYANPLGDTTAPGATGGVVGDTECKWTLTDTSNVRIDLKVNCGDFANGDAMANSNTGSATTTAYGGYSWYSGMTYTSKKTMKVSSTDILYTSATAGSADIKWGAEISTKTNDWSSSTNETATLSIVATKHNGA